MDHAAKSGTRVLVAALAVCAGLCASSCYRLLATRVSKIEGNLVKYEGTVVMVYGKVKERIDVPGLKCYVVDDGSGSIGVVTRGTLPRVGDVVHPKGTVKSGFKIGRRALIVLLQSAPSAAPAPKAPTPKGPPPAALPS